MATITGQLGDGIQARIIGFQREQHFENVLNFTVVTAMSDIEIDLILILIQCFVTHLLPALSPQFRYDSVVWKRVMPALSPEFITQFPAGSVGSGGANDLPTFASVVVSLRTEMGGRSKRGRMYLPPPSEDSTLDGNTVDSAGGAWAAYVAFCQCLVSKFIVGDPPGTKQAALAVYSRKLGGSHFPYQSQGYQPIISVTPHKELATMRSRKLGRGI